MKRLSMCALLGALVACTTASPEVDEGEVAPSTLAGTVTAGTYKVRCRTVFQEDDTFSHNAKPSSVKLSHVTEWTLESSDTGSAADTVKVGGASAPWTSGITVVTESDEDNEGGDWSITLETDDLPAQGTLLQMHVGCHQSGYYYFEP